MIWNLGSINIDRVHGLAHLPQPRETIAARSHARGPGGKGASQSVAAIQVTLPGAGNPMPTGAEVERSLSEVPA